MRKRKIIWSRRSVAVMCSPAFFAASFGVGVLLALGPFESLFGRDMARGARAVLTQAQIRRLG